MAASDLVRRKIPGGLPAWDLSEEQAFCQDMDGGEYARFEQRCLVAADARKPDQKEFSADNIRAKLAVSVLVDADGKRIFEEGDEDWLVEKSAAMLARIWNVAAPANAITQQDLKELEKN